MLPTGGLLTFTAICIFYVAARAGAESGVRVFGDRPGVRGFFHWLPIAAVGIAMAITGRWEVAIGMMLSTTLGMLCLVMGIAVLSGEDATIPRSGLFLLPASLLLFLIGFSGHVTGTHVIMIGIFAAVMVIARETAFRPAPKIEKPRRALAAMDVLICFVLSAFIAWAADVGSKHLIDEIRIFTPSMVGSLMLAPAMVLPMIGTGQMLVRNGKGMQVGGMVTTACLLNLCLLLPICAALALWLHPTDQGLYFPIINWRIDTVVLVLIAGFFLPVVQKNWSIGWLEAVLLIAAYAAYLSITMRAGVRAG